MICRILYFFCFDISYSNNPSPLWINFSAPLFFCNFFHLVLFNTNSAKSGIGISLGTDWLRLGSLLENHLLSEGFPSCPFLISKPQRSLNFYFNSFRLHVDFVFSVFRIFKIFIHWFIHSFSQMTFNENLT